MPFQIVRNDITKMHVDAIVNTANPMPGYGPGIDRAVYEAAGKDKLLAKRREIGAIARGTSVITDGYHLPAKFIIKTLFVAMGGNPLPLGGGRKPFFVSAINPGSQYTFVL